MAFENFWNSLLRIVRINPAPNAELERAISYYRLMDKVYEMLNGYEYIVDVMIEDDGGLTVLVSGNGGKLYALPVEVRGDDIELGQRVQVMQSYEPVEERQRSVTVLRQADGSYRWLFRACSAVLNRSGELDSTDLFDTFMKRFYERDSKGKFVYPRPFGTVRHAGQSLEWGVCDRVYRDGYLLIMTGTFLDTELGRSAADSLQRDSAYWGCSIGYRLETNDAPPQLIEYRVRSADGKDYDLPIPVYTEGTLVEVSLLREADAAAWFTDTYRIGVERMTTRLNEGQLKDLETLLGNTEALKAFLAQNDLTNRSIKAEGLIAREAETAPAPVPSPNHSELVLDDNALAALVKALIAPESGFLKAVAALVPTPAPTPQLAEIRALEIRLKQLESGLKQAAQDNADDSAPNRKQGRIAVTYRASNPVASQVPALSDMEAFNDIRKDALDLIPD